MAVTMPAQVAADQRDVRGGHRHVGAGADGDAQVGLGQRRRVVDAVADHRDRLALRLQRADLGRLLLRAAPRPARGRGCPTCRAMASAVRAVVAGQHPDLEAQRPQLRDRLARLRLERVGDGDQRRRAAVDRHVHRRGAARGDRLRRRQAVQSTPSARVGAPVAEHDLARPRRSRCMPCPAIASNAVGRGTVEPALAAAARRSPRRAGAREPTSAAAASRSSSSSVRPSAGRTPVTAGLPRVSVPVLSSTIVSIRARLLQRLAAADQDAVLGRLAGADHDRGRRGQAQRAGAGDDQHGDGRLQREGQARLRAEQQPADEGQRRQDQHDRDEELGDPVGQALHRRLRALRLLDQAHDLRQRRVAPDPVRVEERSCRSC